MRKTMIIICFSNSLKDSIANVTLCKNHNIQSYRELKPGNSGGLGHTDSEKGRVQEMISDDYGRDRGAIQAGHP